MYKFLNKKQQKIILELNLYKNQGFIEKGGKIWRERRPYCIDV